MLRRKNYEDMSPEEREKFSEWYQEEMAEVGRQMSDAATGAAVQYRELLYQVVDKLFHGKVDERLVARAYEDIINDHIVTDETLAAMAIDLPGAGALYEAELSKMIAENTFGTKEYWKRIGREFVSIVSRVQ